MLARRFAAMTVALCGCSFFTPLSGFATGEESESAGADDAGAGSGSAADATTSGDAGADARVPCSARSPAPTFCKDFDSQSDVDDGWDYHPRSGASSSATLDRSRSHSPPASLRVVLPAGVPGTGSGLTNRLGMNAKATVTRRAHYELDVRLDKSDPTRFAYLSTLGLGAPTSYALTLWASATQTGIREEGDLIQSNVTTPCTRAMPVGVWSHVEIDVDFAATPPSVTVTIDGAVALDKHPLSSGARTGGGSFTVGLSYYTNGDVVETIANFDNVALDVE